MKAFLDHYGYRWMVHRPEQKMFTKQAVVISTAAGSGTKSANKDIADSMFFWGVPKTYRYGVNVRATNYSGVTDELKKKIDKKTTSIANKVKKNNGELPQYYIKDNHPAIIPREMFFEIQEELARRRSKKPANTKKAKTNRGRLPAICLSEGWSAGTAVATSAG